MQPERSCPCGSGESARNAVCPSSRGNGKRGTAEELMRSRYSAFAIGDVDYLWRTWHPRTRPERVRIEPAWRGPALEIIEAAGEEGEFVGALPREPTKRDAA